MGVKPFNTHEKREFVKLYVAAYMGRNCRALEQDWRYAIESAEEAWSRANQAGLIQDHDAAEVAQDDQLPATS